MSKLKWILTLGILGWLPAQMGCQVWDRITASGSAGRMKVTYLRIEYLEDPLGIEVVRPRFSWLVTSSRRGQRQTAYRILAASDPDILKQDRGDLWDTGKVLSDQTSQVVYDGSDLDSRMACFWKVRAWDKDDQPTAWSTPARWTMGLLHKEDWQADWIGYDAPPPASYQRQAAAEAIRLDDCPWVWFAEGRPQTDAPAGTRYFRREFSLAAKPVAQARMLLGVDNELELFVNGRPAGTATGWKPPKPLDLTGHLQAGRNVLAIAAKNTGGPAGLVGKLVVTYADGSDQVLRIDSSWKASEQKASGWEAAGFDDGGWPAVLAIAAVGDSPWGKLEADPTHLPPPPYLRKEFTAARRVRRATVYASALGIYELHLNGRRIGADYFTPGWTDYRKRVYYQAYDVTDLVTPGGNALGAVLADGWYAGYVGFGRRRNHYGDAPRLMVQLELEYDDGGRQIVATDASWKAAYGPLLEADFLMGETYDARLTPDGWTQADFDDSAWQPVAVAEPLAVPLQRHPGVTVQETGRIKPVAITEPVPGRYVFDLGVNFAGVARLRIRGSQGRRVVMRFAEVLNPDGTIYTENLRAARATDSYICRGSGTETWQPRFTYHGFRYVEVTGLEKKPPPDMITGVVLNSNTPPAGEFACSSPMINQLYSNIVRTQKANFIEVPTDCPQRDERLGWTGDAQIFIRSATCNMDVASFFTKWLVDLEDAQSPAGAFPDVAPRLVALGDGTAAWGDAGVICPWTIYQAYGDTRVIERHYESMVKWIDYLRSKSTNLLRPAQGYGDWVSIGSDTPKDVIATAYFAYSTRLLGRMAEAIGRTQDAQTYEALFQEIKKAFNDAYVADDGRIKGDTQTCYLLGLKFDLLWPEHRRQAARYLYEDVRDHDGHLTTGFVGLSYLLPVLTETGNLEVAYRLLNNDTFPSWGYSIRNGATSIWERWDGWTEQKGFQTSEMNSFAHYTFGSVCEWMFQAMAGIDMDGPGYKKILLRPRPGGGFTNVRAAYDSIHGRIGSAWTIDDGKFRWTIEVPANTTATVFVPTASADSVREGGRPAAEAAGVTFLRQTEDAAVYEVGSGRYVFTADIE